MRITGRIWIGIAPLLAGYIVSQVVNTYASIKNEELLTRSVEAVDGALDGKDILVEFDTMLNQYTKAITEQDEDADDDGGALGGEAVHDGPSDAPGTPGHYDDSTASSAFCLGMLVGAHDAVYPPSTLRLAPLR